MTEHMTVSPAGGNDLAPVRLPDGVVGFGLAEVAYLLSRHDGEAPTKSAGLLGTTSYADNKDFLLAGASSLVARGLLTEGAGDIARTLGDAAGLEYALGSAQRWIRLEIATNHGADLAVVVRAPEVAAVLQPRAVGSWLASLVAADDLAAGLLRVLQELVFLHQEVSVGLLAESTHESIGAVYVRKDGEIGAWDTVDRTQDRNNEARTSLDDTALTTLLGRLV